jgi:hemerythrin superfamily protein
MNALDLLEQQHREVERLFREAKKANGAAREELFIQLADDLAAHATIEERVFYPASKEDRTEDALREAVEEHLSMKRLLADMLELEVDAPQFEAKLSVLEEQVKHHVEEEEKELFKKVSESKSKEELEELGVEMAGLWEMLKESEPRLEVPKETDEAPTLQ